MGAVNYSDFIAQLGPDDKITRLIEMMNKTNRILDDMSVVECNMVQGHKTSIRTGLPEAAWRLLNYGVPKGKSQVTSVIDTCGMLEAYAEVDKDLAKINGNSDEFRLSEARAYVEGMNQTMASTLFYGNQSVDPAKFTGLAPRYGGLSTDPTKAGYNVINAGGSNAEHRMTSLWLLVWGENTMHGIIPKGSKAGLEHQNLGEVTATDDAGGMYQVLRDHFKWDLGFTLRDWRHGVRVANIDLDAIDAAGTTIDLIDKMTDAYYKIPNLEMGRAVWYGNKDVMSWLHKQVRKASAYQLTQDNVAGKPVLNFLGIPIKKCDAILTSEDVVS